MTFSVMDKWLASICMLLVIANQFGKSSTLETCPNVPGVTYSPCPSYSPNPVADAGPYHPEVLSGVVSCDTKYTFGDTTPERYKIDDAIATQAYVTIYDLDIPPLDKVFMRTFSCNGQCVHVTLDSNVNTPLTFLTETIRWQVHATNISGTSFDMAVTPVYDCPTGWVNYCSLCYKYFETPMVWQRAQQHCRQHSGYLATITSDSINAFVSTMVSQDVWIGLTDSETEGTFKWINGSNSAYRSWKSGHPRAKAVKDTDCIQKAKQQSPLEDFTDEYCWTPKKFVCERWGPDDNFTQVDNVDYYTYTGDKEMVYYIIDSSSSGNYYYLNPLEYTIPENETIAVKWDGTTSEFNQDDFYMGEMGNALTFTLKGSVPAVTIKFYIEYYNHGYRSCDKGWHDLNTRCYKVVTEKKSYNDAYNECSDLHADLALVQSFMENEFITSKLTAESWIQVEDFWRGEEQWSYTDDFYAWHENNPNNLGNDTDCGYIVPEIDGVAWTQSPHGLNWYNGDCADIKDYVCEKSASEGRYEGTVRVDECTYREFTALSHESNADHYQLVGFDVPVVEIFELTLSAGASIVVKPSDCRVSTCEYKTIHAGDSLPVYIPIDEEYFALKASKSGSKATFRMIGPKDCAPGWIQHGTQCYKFFRERKSWDDAKTDCAAYGATLATIYCQKVTDKLSALVERDTWVGLSKEINGNYTWQDGSSLSWESVEGVEGNFSLVNWDSGEPSLGLADKACGQLNHASSSGDDVENLAVTTCTTRNEYICQKTADFTSDSFQTADTCTEFELTNMTTTFFQKTGDKLRVAKIYNITTDPNVIITVKPVDCVTAACEYSRFNSTSEIEPVTVTVPEDRFVIVATGGEASMVVFIDTDSVCIDAQKIKRCDYCLAYSSTPKDYTAAEAFCSNLNGALVSIHSAEQNSDYLDIIEQDTWIGLKNVPHFRNATYTVDNWTWLDGTPLDFTQWHSNKSASRGAPQDYAVLIKPIDGVPWRNRKGEHWDNLDHSQARHTLCRLSIHQPIGASCTQVSECLDANAVCNYDVCRCASPRVPVDGECLIGKSLGEGCIGFDERCLPENSRCDDRGSNVCVCEAGHVIIRAAICAPEAAFGAQCEYDEQCSAVTDNTECRHKLCDCIRPLVKSVTDTCVPIMIELDIVQTLDSITYTSDMAGGNSAGYGQVYGTLSNIYGSTTGFVSINNLVITNDGGKAGVTFTLKRLNPDMDDGGRIKRDVTSINIPKDDVIEDTKKTATRFAESTGVMKARIARGGLYEYCISADDCAFGGASCISSACSCVSGTLSTKNGEEICETE